MLRCLSSSRFAVCSTVVRPVLHISGHSQPWHKFRQLERAYSTVPEERQQDETVYMPAHTSHLESDPTSLNLTRSEFESEPWGGLSQPENVKLGADEHAQGSAHSRDVLELRSSRSTHRVRPGPTQRGVANSEKPGHTRHVVEQTLIRKIVGEQGKLTRRGRIQMEEIIQRRLSSAQQGSVAARWRAYYQGRHERPRSSSTRAGLRTSAVLSSSWNLKYASISKQYDSLLADAYLQEVPAPSFQPHTAEWVEHLLGQVDREEKRLDVEAFARTCGKIGREVWSEVALWLMYHDIDRLLDFLVATNTLLYPPINWVEDCLSHLARYYNHLPLHDQRGHFQKLTQVALALVHRDTNEQFVFVGGFMRHLLPHCTAEQVNELYALTISQRVRVWPNTLHHFSDWFAKNRYIEQALDALLEAKAAGGNVHGLAFRKNCATVLHQSRHHPNGLRVCLRIIENLVDIGVKLDTFLCNIIMHNAVEAGDLDTMHSVRRSAIEQGLQDDKYTCAILLKACKLQIDDAHYLRDVIEQVIHNANVRSDVVLATEILHCLTLHHSRNNPQTAFQTVSEAYVQLFDPAPLERLGLVMPAVPRTHDTETPPMAPMAPSPHAICFVVASLLEMKPNPIEAQHLYTRWRNLVEAGDADLAPLATTPYLSNLFLHKLCRYQSSLLSAAHVVRDMEGVLPASAGVRQCGPDIYTWSIFLDGFARKGQMQLAEQVLNYMHSKGMEPNTVTWVTLIGGYAGKQDLKGTLESLRRYEASGEVYNAWTARGLARFKNQRRLRDELEKERYQQSMDFTDDLKQELEAKLMTPDESTQGTAADVEDGTWEVTKDFEDSAVHTTKPDSDVQAVQGR